VNLIDHLDHDHILFAGGGSPNFLVVVYIVEKVQEVGAWRGVSQVCLIDMCEACYRVASGSLERGVALRHEDWGQSWCALLGGGTPSTRGWWGGGQPLCLFLWHDDGNQRAEQRDPYGIRVT